MAGSDLRHASIDGEIYTGDVRTFIGGEESDCCRDFLRHASATQGGCAAQCSEIVAALYGRIRSRAEGVRLPGSEDRPGDRG